MKKWPGGMMRKNTRSHKEGTHRGQTGLPRDHALDSGQGFPAVCFFFTPSSHVQPLIHTGKTGNLSPLSLSATRSTSCPPRRSLWSAATPSRPPTTGGASSTKPPPKHAKTLSRLSTTSSAPSRRRRGVRSSGGRAWLRKKHRLGKSPVCLSIIVLLCLYKKKSNRRPPLLRTQKLSTSPPVSATSLTPLNTRVG